MPPLSTPRTRRRFGEVAAAIGLTAALWGPIGPAEAGASAGSAANFKRGPAQGISVGSKLGRGPAAAELNLLEGSVAERLSTCSPSTYSTSFTTRLASGWTSLNARSSPCTSASVTGTWTSGVTFSVNRYTSGGTNICRGSSYGYGSSYWYRTSRGWVWSGATTSPIWNTGC